MFCLVYIRVAYQHTADVHSPQTIVANAERNKRQSLAVCSSKNFVSFYAETSAKLDPATFSVQKMVSFPQLQKDANIIDYCFFF